MDTFLVSIQWGKGYHYFVTPFPISKDRAEEVAKYHVDMLQCRGCRRGARPVVRVLDITSERHIKPRQ